MVLDDIPDLFRIYTEVVMGNDIAKIFDLLPGHFGMGITEIYVNSIDHLSNVDEVDHARIKTFPVMIKIVGSGTLFRVEKDHID